MHFWRQRTLHGGLKHFWSGTLMKNLLIHARSNKARRTLELSAYGKMSFVAACLSSKLWCAVKFFEFFVTLDAATIDILLSWIVNFSIQVAIWPSVVCYLASYLFLTWSKCSRSQQRLHSRVRARLRRIKRPSKSILFWLKSTYTQSSQVRRRVALLSSRRNNTINFTWHIINYKIADYRPRLQKTS